MLKLKPDAESGSVRVAVNGDAIGRLIYRILHKDRPVYASKLKNAGNGRVLLDCDGVKIEDHLTPGNGRVIVKRRWTIEKPGTWQLCFTFVPEKQDYTDLIVPSVMYHDNRHGEGKFPKGGVQAGWSFKEDRISIPSCSVLHDSTSYLAVFTEPAKDEYDISSVRTFEENGKRIFEIKIPFAEEPYSYREKGMLFGGLRKARNAYFRTRRSNIPFEYERTFYIQTGELPGNVFRIFHDLSSFAVKNFSQNDARNSLDWSTFASLRLHHLLFLVVDDPKENIACIQQGKGNPWWYQHAHKCTSGSFLVKSLEAAVVLSKVGHELRNKALIDMAERMGRFFLQGELKNGLHRDVYWFSRKKWESFSLPLVPGGKQMREGANARCNGEVMFNYLRLYRFMNDGGREIPEFRAIAERNARFYIENQLRGEREGSFGRWWSADGKPINTLGTNGAHIVSFLIELEKATGCSEAVDRAIKNAASYYGSLIASNEYYGDTLDADCVDAEAGMVLLRCFLDLYERGRDEKHLELAKDAAGFVLSWIFTYNVPFKPDSPLGKEHFQTKGTTACSVALHHVDFYGMYVAYDYLRLWQATGNGTWKDWAALMIESSRQLIATEENTLNRSKEYIGWQPEHIYQTDWDYFLDNFGGKGTYDTCIAWVVVLVLGAMLDIRERFPDVLNFSFDKATLKNLNSDLF